MSVKIIACNRRDSAVVKVTKEHDGVGVEQEEEKYTDG